MTDYTYNSMEEYVKFKLDQLELWVQEQGYVTSRRELPCGSYGGHIQLWEKNENDYLRHVLSILWYAKGNRYRLCFDWLTAIDMPGLQTNIKDLLAQCQD